MNHVTCAACPDFTSLGKYCWSCIITGRASAHDFQELLDRAKSAEAKLTAIREAYKRFNSYTYRFKDRIQLVPLETMKEFDAAFVDAFNEEFPKHVVEMVAPSDDPRTHNQLITILALRKMKDELSKQVDEALLPRNKVFWCKEQYGRIDYIAEAATKAGFKFFEWNDRLYSVFIVADRPDWEDRGKIVDLVAPPDPMKVLE